MNDYKTSEHHYLNIILEEIEYSEWYKIKKMRFCFWPAAGWMKKKSHPAGPAET